MKSGLKNFLITALTAFSLLMPVASAQVVTVTGTGMSEDYAVKDAKRNAVEQVAGTTIRARSAAVDLALVFDTIDARTQGYVNSCKVLNRKTDGGLITVTAQVDVSAEPNSSLMQDLDLALSLHDPRLAVVTENYGDDDGENYRRHAARCSAAIREKLISIGFSHVVDNPADNAVNANDVDYIISNNLTVGKPRTFSLPRWGDIQNPQITRVDTGLFKYEAVIDGRIKKADTNEIVGEFHSTGENITAEEGGLDNQAVEKMAANAANEIRTLFKREATKVFSSVRIMVQCHDSSEIFKLEESIRQIPGVNSVHIRSLTNGVCIMDVDTDLSPIMLYRLLIEVTKDDMKLGLQGFSSTVLNLSIE